MTNSISRAMTALRLTVCALALLFCTMPGTAKASPSEDTATVFITKLVDEAVNNVIGGKLTQNQKEERFRQLFVEAADIPKIASFVVGREWRKLKPEEKNQFIELLEDVSVLTWISHLEEYKGLKIKITGAYTDRSDVFVESGIALASGSPIPIVWRVQKHKDGHLKLIDIIIEANSMLINTRKQYASVMKREGGISGLIASLENMRATLRNERSTK